MQAVRRQNTLTFLFLSLFAVAVTLWYLNNLVVEETACRGAAYYIMVTQEGGLVTLGVRGSGLQSPSFQLDHGSHSYGIQIEKEEDEESEEYYLRIVFDTRINDAGSELHRNGGV